ncbi:hypothetical protein [Mobiluncus mulieris]|uniref:hypothetical protein n=1 Tax=Mobiluncus mulieris TaxID=2052 RepID=UPI001359750E|nr:hypothetical protein [Mobiluncus mulieris]
MNAVKDNALVDAKTAEVKAAALSAVTNVNAGDVAAKLVESGSGFVWFVSQRDQAYFE